MNKFQLTSDYQPTGDQPEAIRQLTDGILQGLPAQTLLGVTGSGKTFTIANVIANINKPTLILSHNKTLAAQLYSEFKGFFPHNAVEYYVSYYDYYQPEAYLPSSDTYIEKDLAINDEIDKLRLAATSALLSGRKDVIVVSSVSCIYGMGNPADFYNNSIDVVRGKMFSRNVFLRRLVDSLYQRNDLNLNRGNFRVKGDTVDIFLAYSDNLLRVVFWGDEVDSIEEVDPVSGVTLGTFDSYKIYPANLFMTTKENTLRAIHEIEDDLHKQVEFFEKEGRMLEAKRIYERVTYDMEMLRELGHCSGIENYSRYFDGRARPYCLLDFFPEDYLIVIDESHVSVPQIRAMYGGDRARKENLVEYGFRLPAARDNRPLTFDEFEALARQVIYVSATPADYELVRSEGIVVEQVIRPTGLLDPVIEVRPTHNQIDDLMEEIQLRIEKEERVLVTTLTKRMAEELAGYINDRKFSVASKQLESLKSRIDLDIPQNKQYFLEKQALLEFEQGKVTREEFVKMEKEVLECTLRAENLYRKENVYLTEQEITCIRNSWRGMEGKEKRELIDLIFRLYDNYALNNGLSQAISMYEFIAESAVNELGNNGEHVRAEEIDRKVIKASLSCRRIWDVHYNLYDILWNENEIVKKSGKRVSNDQMNTELKRCIIMSHYVKRYFYENVYKEKLS